MAGRPHIVGYAQPWSLCAGEHVEVMLSCDSPLEAEASLIRLGSGEVDGAASEDAVLDLGAIRIAPQPTRLGSCVIVPVEQQSFEKGSFVAAALCMPTRIGARQALIAQADESSRWWLGLDEHGRASAEIEVRDGTSSPLCACHVEDPLVAGAWYLVAAGFDPEGDLSVRVRPLPRSASWQVEFTNAVLGGDASVQSPSALSGLVRGRLVIGAAPRGDDTWGDVFDGKIERPTLLSGPLDEEAMSLLESDEVARERVLARWQLGVPPHADEFHPTRNAGSGLERTLEMESTIVRCFGTAACEGQSRNSPLRAVTGHTWDGNEIDFRLVPDQYAAMHFHSDDLDDSGWEPTVAFDLPLTLRSGVYGLRVEAIGRPIERVPFFVRATERASDLLFLVPTASYLAYANDHPVSDGAFSEATAASTPVLYEDDLLLHEHREWGLSMYDSHLDGSGVAVSSYRRPLINMRATHRYHVGPWQLAADLSLLSWLGEADFPFDVATDGDLDQEGRSLLSDYRVLLTGTHPEYFSSGMLDAVEDWVRTGGRLVYIGANGFYWRVAFDRDRPWVMELRRGHAGSRAWESSPGEDRLMFTGEAGGLWRHFGRPPQKLTGVGYAAQGFDASGWYRRLPASNDRRAAWIFEGVADETFGTRGRIGGGAVGQELDRCDSSLGSPSDALVLATSEGLTEGYQRCVEEVPFTLPGLSALVDPDVRSDLVYHVKPGGGAVFATGSIAWAGALGVDEGVDRITRNVLTRFLDETPLEW